MTRRTRSLGTLALLAAIGAPSATLAADEVNISKGATVAGPGLAARGYDVVAYFKQGRPTLGSDKFAIAHEGATYWFSSRANLDAFRANPARYTPAFGGFCAYGAAKGKKFDGDPRRWKIVGNRLYFNLNGDVQGKWSQDVPGNIMKADENWRRIEHRSVGEL